MKGPVHVQGELLTAKRVGSHLHLTLVAPGIAERFRPGNFVAVSHGDRARLARTSIWIHRVRPTGSHGPTVELVVDRDTWPAGLAQGERVALTGPLGRPFAQPKEPVACLLVGEAHGSAPLFALAERLRERGCPVSMLLGAPDEAHLFGALEARRSARAVTVVTGDGSVGQHGTIADVVADALGRSAADVVYAVGSAPTLHAVAAAAEQHGAWSQTAVEVDQPCATGLCFGCAVPVIGDGGVRRTVRACADGPVFRGDRVRWGALTGSEGGDA